MKAFNPTAFLLAFILMVQTATTAQAQSPLATVNISKGFGARSIINSVNASLGFGTNSSLFDQFMLTPADVGSKFTLDSSNDPEFAAFALTLQNGLANQIAFRLGGGTSITSESAFFNPLPAGSNGIDFQGFLIGSVSMTVHSLSIDSPGSNPNRDGNWTDISFQATITVNAVPEPSALVMLSLGVGILGMFKNRSRA